MDAVLLNEAMGLAAAAILAVAAALGLAGRIYWRARAERAERLIAAIVKPRGFDVTI